jgi:hypothetical protein
MSQRTSLKTIRTKVVSVLFRQLGSCFGNYGIAVKTQFFPSLTWSYKWNSKVSYSDVIVISYYAVSDCISRQYTYIVGKYIIYFYEL